MKEFSANPFQSGINDSSNTYLFKEVHLNHIEKRVFLNAGQHLLLVSINYQ